tara:strand:- start:417 stop:1370 length:954 start_codon:yes stop_codon:yes gene_type:complete
MFKKIITFLQILLLTIPLNAARSYKVEKWMKIRVEKGFILSHVLQHELNCILVWDRQIPHFMQKNEHIKNVDDFEIGDIVDIQVCDGGDFISPYFTVLKDEPTPVTAPVIIPVQQPTIIKEKEIIREVIKEKEEKGFFLSKESPEFEILLGSLVENEDDGAAYLSFRSRNDFDDSMGYRLTFEVSPLAIYHRHQIEFKTTPMQKHQWYFGLGIGQRVGLKDSTDSSDQRLSDGLDTFSYISGGYIMRPSDKSIFEVELGGNLAPKFSPILSLSLLKQMKNDYWIGVFSEYRSSRSLIDSKGKDKERRYIINGVKFSF